MPFEMPSLTGSMDTVKGALFNKKFLIIMVIVVIFLGVAFYVYNTYIAPRINPDFVPAGTAEIRRMWWTQVITKSFSSLKLLYCKTLYKDLQILQEKNILTQVFLSLLNKFLIL